MEGSISELREELKGKANIVIINADHAENYEFSNQMGIRVVPTLMFMDKDHNLVDVVEGLMTKKQLLEKFMEAGVE